MPVGTAPALDAQRLRADFAVFEELLDGKPIAGPGRPKRASSSS